MGIANRIKERVDAMSPRQRQYTTVGIIGAAGTVLLWLVFSLSDSNADPSKKIKKPTMASGGAVVTNITVPGQIAPLEEWVGNAGKKLAQYDNDKQLQDRENEERRRAEAALWKRLAELESRKPSADAPPPAQTGPGSPTGTLFVPPGMPAAGTPVPPNLPPGMPPGTPVSPSSSGAAGTRPTTPSTPQPQVEVEAPIVRVTLGSTAKAGPADQAPAQVPASGKTSKPTSYMPVGFMRATMIAGINAPTGGQAQENPLPVLLRVTDNAFLPNHFRAHVRECFVIGAGYGKISDERAYIRTVSLSCVRRDGSRLEVELKGNVVGEDGILGMRGKLVTKQGQILANALRAGIVSGIGQGFSQSGTTFSGSALGNVATQSGGTAQQLQRGIGRGVGNAMERLADYYIQLAEQVHPVIEVGGMRDVDILLTQGVDIGAPLGETDQDDTPSWTPGGQP